MTESLSYQDYNKLVKKKKTRSQPEGQLQMAFGRLLKSSWRSRLNPNLAFYTYSGAGEKKDKKGAYWQYRKGLQKGDLDYRFELVEDNKLNMVYLELKGPTGSLTPEQRNFIERHKDLDNAVCGTAKSLQEIEQFLIDSKVFIA